MIARILMPSLSIGALFLLLPLLPPGPADAIDSGRDLASLVPDRALVYVEAPGLS